MINEGEGESSNHYHDFVPAKGLLRWLGRDTCLDDRNEHKQSTRSIHSLYSQNSFSGYKGDINDLYKKLCFL